MDIQQFITQACIKACSEKYHDAVSDEAKTAALDLQTNVINRLAAMFDWEDGV